MAPTRLTGVRENHSIQPTSRLFDEPQTVPGGNEVAGTEPVAEGITNPPIDDLLELVDSKYSLVTMASKRARQINAYYAQLGEGLLEYVGPLVETQVQEKSLSIALREVKSGLLTAEPFEGL